MVKVSEDQISQMPNWNYISPGVCILCNNLSFVGKLGNRNTIFNLKQNLIWYNLVSSPPPTSHRFFSHRYQPTLCSFSLFFNETEQNNNQNKDKARQINKSQNEWNKTTPPQNQINTDFIFCPPTTFDLGPTLKCGWYTQLIYTLMEKTDFLRCQQISTANSFLVRGGMLCSLLLLSSETSSVLDV